MYKNFEEIDGDVKRMTQKEHELAKIDRWVIAKNYIFTKCSWFFCCLPKKTKEELATETAKFKAVQNVFKKKFDIQKIIARIGQL